MLIATFTVFRENVFCQGVVDLLNPLRVLLSGELPFFKSDVLKFSKVDDLQNTVFDRLKITESNCLDLYVFLKVREARRKETFHAITDCDLSNVLIRNFK